MGPALRAECLHSAVRTERRAELADLPSSGQALAGLDVTPFLSASPEEPAEAAEQVDDEVVAATPRNPVQKSAVEGGKKRASV